MPKRIISQNDRKNGRISLADDLARALLAAEDRPPWECPGLTPEDRLDITFTLIHAPIGSKWRYAALEKLHYLVFLERDEIPDWETRRRTLAWALEDEEIFSHLPRRHHVCDPSRCTCVPPAPRFVKQ